MYTQTVQHATYNPTCSQKSQCHEKVITGNKDTFEYYIFIFKENFHKTENLKEHECGQKCLEFCELTNFLRSIQITWVLLCSLTS